VGLDLIRFKSAGKAEKTTEGDLAKTGYVGKSIIVTDKPTRKGNGLVDLLVKTPTKAATTIAETSIFGFR